jgi:hypothetical protein
MERINGWLSVLGKLEIVEQDFGFNVSDDTQVQNRVVRKCTDRSAFRTFEITEYTLHCEYEISIYPLLPRVYGNELKRS